MKPCSTSYFMMIYDMIKFESYSNMFRAKHELGGNMIKMPLGPFKVFIGLNTLQIIYYFLPGLFLRTVQDSKLIRSSFKPKPS